MSRTVIKNATIVTMDPMRRVLTDHVLVIEGDRIQALVPASDFEGGANDEVIDATDRFILPGFVNTHVHTVQQLGRGLADDVDLMTLLHKRIFPYESNVQEDDSYTSTMLFGLEQIANGTTTFADAGIQHPAPTARAVEQLGLRAALCLSITDDGEGLPEGWKLPAKECISIQEQAFDAHHGGAGGRIRWWFGLRTLFNNSDDLLRMTAERSRALATGIHMHVAQSQGEVAYCQNTRGTTVIRHFRDVGLLGSNFLGAHCIYIDEEEQDLLAEFEVKVSHNPGAGLKIMGIPRIVALLEKGVRVGLATDSGASNNRNSMIDEMWLTTILQKGSHGDPSVTPAQQVLEMATIHAAECLGWEDEVGSIEQGKKADLCVIDPWTNNMQPMHDPISNMVFCMKTENVESTMCDGRWLMRDRKFPHLDEQEILREASGRAAAIRERGNIELPARFPWS